MNLSSSGGISGSGEMAELLLAHSMSAAQQHLKYATSFAGLSASDGTLSMDYNQQQPQQMHSNTRLSLAGVGSNGESLHNETKDALLGQTGSIPTPSPAHHMHQSAAAMAAMMLDGRVGYVFSLEFNTGIAWKVPLLNSNCFSCFRYHQAGVSYGSGAMSQLPTQSASLPSTQASEYPSMSLF